MTDTDCGSRKYRVFVSYSHEDRALVEKIVRALTLEGLDVMWDPHLTGGMQFTEQIRSFIAHAHVFCPILTPQALKRPWVMREIGFAEALNVAFCPVLAGGAVASDAPLGSKQAVVWTGDHEANLRDLSHHSFELVIDAARHEGPILVECAQDNPRRALLLAQYADRVSNHLDRFGCVRQRASLTSFHLPDREPRDSIWREFFGANHEELLFEYLRAERTALVRHVRAAGCKLIIDSPDVVERVYEKFGPQSAPARIASLIQFLEHPPSEQVLAVVNTDPNRHESLTIVDDWFSSEAVSSGSERILREAVFTRHAPTVLQQIKDFDTAFDDLLTRCGWDRGNCRQRTVEHLKDHLASGR